MTGAPIDPTADTPSTRGQTSPDRDHPADQHPPRPLMISDKARAAATIRAALDAYGDLKTARDDLIQDTHQAGIGKTEIAARMAIGRRTVYRVLDAADQAR
jgi:Helix-turn-helix domain of resolvase